MPTIEVVLGDITCQDTDAVVNAANTSLLGGGGVDGAIHRAAGPGLLEECRRLGGCPAGEVRVTGGHRLPSRYVIHAVGPVWRGGGHGEEALLAACYRQAVETADGLRVRSLAFPGISTGAYGFPVRLAAPVALRAVRSALATARSVELVRFVCYTSSDVAVYTGLLEHRGEG